MAIHGLRAQGVPRESELDRQDRDVPEVPLEPHCAHGLLLLHPLALGRHQLRQITFPRAPQIGHTDVGVEVPFDPQCVVDHLVVEAHRGEGPVHLRPECFQAREPQAARHRCPKPMAMRTHEPTV